MVRQLRAAFGYAHKSNVVYCDIKPANVILTREGVLKVCDFDVT